MTYHIEVVVISYKDGSTETIYAGLLKIKSSHIIVDGRIIMKLHMVFAIVTLSNGGQIVIT